MQEGRSQAISVHLKFSNEYAVQEISEQYSMETCCEKESRISTLSYNADLIRYDTTLTFFLSCFVFCFGDIYLYHGFRVFIGFEFDMAL